MILPSGVNKAAGLAATLDELGLSAHHVVGVGDAENDRAFLHFCGCYASVANALPALREQSQLVTKHAHGKGVAELIDLIIDDDRALRTASPDDTPRWRAIDHGPAPR